MKTEYGTVTALGAYKGDKLVLPVFYAKKGLGVARGVMFQVKPPIIKDDFKIYHLKSGLVIPYLDPKSVDEGKRIVDRVVRLRFSWLRSEGAISKDKSLGRMRTQIAKIADASK